MRERGARARRHVGDRGLTYGELRESAAALADHFEGAERVAVWAESTLATCVAAVAALEAGIPLVPVNPKLGPGELEHVLTDSAPTSSSGGPDGIAPIDRDARGSELPATDRERRGPRADHLHLRHHRPPERRRAAAPRSRLQPRRARRRLGLDRRRRPHHGLPLFHVHGLVLGLFGSLRAAARCGTSAASTRPPPPPRCSDGATMLFGVPTMYHRLGREAEGDARIVDGLRRARLLVSGSAPLPAPEFTRIEQLTGQQIVERYGLTETLINTAVRADSRAPPGLRRRAGAGRRAPPRRRRRQRADRHRRRDDRRGRGARPEPVHRLPQPPDATDEAMRDGWFFTGDLATATPDGYWRIVGRRSTDLIKSGGYKVGAGEIEAALLEHPDVLEAAVIGEPDPDLGERIIACVVPTATPRTSTR